MLDGDLDRVVELLGGNLSTPYQFIRVAEVMAELGRDDDVLAWANRGIAETTGWQVAQLYDLAADVCRRRGATDEVLALRRAQHRQMPSPATYALLRDVSKAAGTWSTDREPARAALASHDLGGLIDVLLDEGEAEVAWRSAVDNPDKDLGRRRWLRLAEAREASDPSDALDVYLRLADDELVNTGRDGYERAASVLKKARRAATASGRQAFFASHVANLRVEHRRRPSLIAIFDRARFP